MEHTELWSGHHINGDYWITAGRKIVRFVGDKQICLGFWAGTDGEARDFCDAINANKSELYAAGQKLMRDIAENACFNMGSPGYDCAQAVSLIPIQPLQESRPDEQA